jgi:hypothetical protein
VSSNSVETHPQDGPDAIAKEAKELGEGARGLERPWASKGVGAGKHPPALSAGPGGAAPLTPGPAPLPSSTPPPSTPGYTFPYLYDASQDAARAYKVACTPEFYVLDSSLNLVYHGQFDDARPKNNAPVTGEGAAQPGRGRRATGGTRGSPAHRRASHVDCCSSPATHGPSPAPPPAGADVRAALDAVLAGKPVPKAKPSIGWCEQAGAGLLRRTDWATGVEPAPRSGKPPVCRGQGSRLAPRPNLRCAALRRSPPPSLPRPQQPEMAPRS